MLSKDKIAIQELIAHPGWNVFYNLVNTDLWDGVKVIRRSLRSKLNADLMVAGRKGDGLDAAKATAALDILDTVLEVPAKYLKGG